MTHSPERNETTLKVRVLPPHGPETEQPQVTPQGNKEAPKEPLKVEEPPQIVEADSSGLSLKEEAGEGADDSQTGAWIGRYRILRRLGQGGFGIVFLAQDQELERLVAIKLPHLRRMDSPASRTGYLNEARTLASLDHPAIVPIYDFGVIGDGRCFVVSKYIEGRDLATALAVGPMNPREVALVVKTVAQALQHVHRAGILHRDVKPANLLFGQDGRVYVADFGLAQRDAPANAKGDVVGTPAYMSPEQIRGEGHRVDGRSDQFSLGVVMYELLTGERAFGRGPITSVLERVVKEELISADRVAKSVPAELGRICQKMIAKLANSRYPDMNGVVSDLSSWLDTQSVAPELPIDSGSPHASTLIMPQEIAASANESEVQKPRTVVPRGLRPFTRMDAEFFPELLPGVRDRNGVPVVISHWLEWATQRDEESDSGRVGVISGPTGCGKSSLVRAGILPALPATCQTVLVEATGEHTERQLQEAIIRRCHAPLIGTLPEQLAAIRTGSGLQDGQSLLIIIDQFEQWLHAHPDPLETELVQAIRQCDGIRIQCVLLIRDDFWLGMSRFMEAVEVPVQLGRNVIMIDLFDLRHATRVLEEFGRGYGQLPSPPQPLSRDQERFIEGAIKNLSTDGKVIPVRLALFAEMVRQRDWTPATLRQFGGTAGIGAQFLNDAFSATYAPANQRFHENAARRVLQSLLPAPGTEIKAGRRLRSDLHLASGYADNRSTFDDLMHVLESDLKLITAADSQDRSKSDSGMYSVERVPWQLSHDFLVPSIREWLAARQRATLRGRLHQRLSEQASLYSHTPNPRYLPGIPEWLLMRCLISSNHLATQEATVLAAADRRALRVLSIAALVGIIAIMIGFRIQSGSHVRSLVSHLRTSVPSEAPRIIDELTQFGSHARNAIHAAVENTPKDSRERFLFQLARIQSLNGSNGTDTADDNLHDVTDAFHYALQHGSLEDTTIAAKMLTPHQERLSADCWARLEVSDVKPDGTAYEDEEKFRAVLMLARFAPPDEIDPSLMERWQSVMASTAKLLLQACSVHPDQYHLIAESVRPLSMQLVPHLSAKFGHEESDVTANFAVALLMDFTSDDSLRFTDLILDASDWQQDRMLPAAKLNQDVLGKAVRQPTMADGTEAAALRTERRRGIAAALLLAPRMSHAVGQVTPSAADEAWDLLRRSPDMTARSHLIHQLQRLKLPVSVILARLKSSVDPGVTAALLQMLRDTPPPTDSLREEARTMVARLFQSDADAGVHSSAEWVLREWNESVVLKSLADDLPTVDAKSVASVANNQIEQSPKFWLRSPLGFTLVRIPANQIPEIHHDFLMSTTEITRDQIRECNPHHYVKPEYCRTGDSPASIVRWSDATAYCNWLSAREGLTPFYPADLKDLNDFTVTAESLAMLGYRLPTEAEWEFASRAGAITDRFFGRDATLLPRYGWFEANNIVYLKRVGLPITDAETDGTRIIAKPVGLLRPNEFGLFDIYGNAEEWCNDRGEHSPEERAMRGGAARSWGKSLNSLRVGSLLPNTEYDSMGFRIVRTVE